MEILKKSGKNTKKIQKVLVFAPALTGERLHAESSCAPFTTSSEPAIDSIPSEISFLTHSLSLSLSSRSLRSASPPSPFFSGALSFSSFPRSDKFVYITGTPSLEAQLLSGITSGLLLFLCLFKPSGKEKKSGRSWENGEAKKPGTGGALDNERYLKKDSN